MNFVWIGFLGTMFFGLTTINAVMEGRFINSTDVSFMNMMSVTQMVKIGFITIPIPDISYISGVSRMMQMGDYSFLSGGNGQFIMFFLYAVSFMVGFTLFVTVLGMGVNFIRGR